MKIRYFRESHYIHRFCTNVAMFVKILGNSFHDLTNIALFMRHAVQHSVQFKHCVDAL